VSDTITRAAMLRGPDPERFRTSYYGARWYIDPLPADDTWTATTDKWPSVTTVKKAWSKPFRKKLPTGDTVPLDAYWAAEFTIDNLPAINALASDRAAAMALICGAGARTLNRAASRGTGVHTILEDLAGGVEPDMVLIDDAVRPYVPACRTFIHDWQPAWVAAEFVAINRTLGYGGTGDAILRITLHGEPWLCIVDWKSRGGQHGCYEEEVAQLGGYSLAEYIIVTGPDGQPIRLPMPAVDGGLVVSLTVDGYQATPIDLDGAQAAFRAMHTSWTEHREGQKAARAARGNPLIPSGPIEIQTPTPPATSLDRLGWLRRRIQVIVDAGHEAALAGLWDLEQVPAPILPDTALTDPQVDQVVEWCACVEAAVELPFPDSDPLFNLAPPEATEAPRVPPADNPVDGARGELARHWTSQAWELFDAYDITGDEEMVAAVLKAAGMDGTETMTRDLYARLAALTSQATNVDGAVQFVYADDGTLTIEPAADAEQRMTATAGTRGEARDRAARLAKQAGHIAPRSLPKAAENPLLAALVAAGHGGADTPTNQENNTT